VGLATKEASKEAAVGTFGSDNVTLRVFTIAPVRCGYGALDWLDVFATSGPCCLLAHAAGDCTAH